MYQKYYANIGAGLKLPNGTWTALIGKMVEYDVSYMRIIYIHVKHNKIRNIILFNCFNNIKTHTINKFI